ncbi:MAG TPA: tetratricopeptide repeat protein [Bryobacteraceae bacterium]|jgi:tol-pal system protein YbgF|nr:tetratricopeptide repeat protein [Bryobacteraceae bacterium]
MKRLKFLTACLILLAGPVALPGQKKEDILEIQRDVALLQDQVRQLQKSQDDKMAALQSMLQQTVDVSNKLTAGLSSLQRQIDQRLSSEQTQLVAPVATLGAKVDQMSSDFSSVATNVEELVRRMAALDTKLNDISQAVRTLSAPPTPPAPAAGAAATGAAGAPAISAETSYNNAYRDYNKGQFDLALQEFADYVKNFPDTADAPTAQYYIGYIYFNSGTNYADAAKAFDDVLERWPENPKTADAMYYKGVALQKLGQKTAAAKTLKDYIAKYPRGEHVEQAHRDLRAMGMEASTAKKQHK